MARDRGTPAGRARKATTTSNFGVGSRESHDASAFYERFQPPTLSMDETVHPPFEVAEPFQLGDSTDMSAVPDGSVALVVTSPPYFAGKQYEEELERDGVPASYVEYLQMLTDVFRECVRTLEPGGRIAVNVANLGRKPYRSLASDVIRILQDDLGLLLRGEIVWQKGEGASGSCAWGSFRGASNPVLRDITERVIVASKGRFDRAVAVKKRREMGLPHESTVLTEDFMALTLDVWSVPPESAKKVGHPAPFPVELPEQLIRLYTFRGDLVLDPFMGSGSSLVAAKLLGRRYVGYDLDPEYVEIARRRVAATEVDDHESSPFGDGKAAHKVAEEVLTRAGFEIVQPDRRVPRTGVTVSFEARDRGGNAWYFDVAGAFTAHRGGLLRAETVWKALGRAAALRSVIRDPDRPVRLVFLTSDLPKRPGEGDAAMRAAGPDAFFDAIDIRSDEGRARLERYAAGDVTRPQPGFWTERDLRGTS